MPFTTATLDSVENALLQLLDECRSVNECTPRELAVVRLAEAMFSRIQLLRRLESGAAAEPEHEELSLMETLLSLAAHAESGALKAALNRGRGNNLTDLIQVLTLAGDAASLEENALRKADAAIALNASAGTDLHLAEKQARDKIAREKGLRK
jgi:hypothetical protein